MSFPTGRLTLASGVPITTSDIVGASSIFYTPALDNTLPLFNGSSLSKVTFAEMTFPLDAGAHLAGQVYDLFAAVVGGVQYWGTGPAWTSLTARSSDLRFDGRWSNVAAMTLYAWSGSAWSNVTVPAGQATYLASFIATANGEATDSFAHRGVSNPLVAARRPMRIADPAASWTYSTSAWRQANGNAANQVTALFGLSGIGVNVKAVSNAFNSTATQRVMAAGVGIDSTTINSANVSQALIADNSRVFTGWAEYEEFPGLGYHAMNWLERGAGIDTQTWQGTNGGSTIFTPGLSGSFFG